MVGSYEKFKLMAVKALVLVLQPEPLNFFRGDEGTGEVVVPECFEGHDGKGAVGGGVGAEELEGDVGDGLEVEGGAAFIWADVVALFPVGDALHTVDPFAAALADEGLDADLQANSALVSLADGLGFDEADGSKCVFLHSLTFSK